MSDVNDKLDAAWRAASREEPPAALDHALRAAARRAVGAGPSGARRHMQSWPLAAAAIVAVLAIGIVRMAPPEQVTPTVVDDNASPPVASKETATTTTAVAPAATEAGLRAAAQAAATSAPTDRPSSGAQRQLGQPLSAPPPKPSVGLVDKPQAPPASGGGSSAPRAVARAPDGDRGAPKSKLEDAADAKKIAAEPFPAAPAESRNAADALTPTSPPTVAGARPGAPTQRENAIDAVARRDEAPSTQGPTPASAARTSLEGQRAKDSAPRTPDEWIKLIRRLQGEGRKDEVAKELTAFRAEYKERANALLPADLREIK